MRELGLLAVVSWLLAVVMNWPLATRLDSHVAAIGFGDPYIQAWQVAWGGHALKHQPLAYFQSNTFWPLADSLAFSDALIGYAPAGLIGSGAQAALVRYNLLYLFAYGLSFLGAFLLARELSAGRLAAATAGAAFAYAPWRISQSTHLHVISSGGIPLCLFLLIRGYRRGQPKTILAGWLVATWQLSLGFTLGLQLAYLLTALSAILVVGWLQKRQARVHGAPVIASAAGILAFVSWTAFQASHYLRVAGDHPESRRTVEEARFYSPSPLGLLASPAENVAWGEPTRQIRNSLNWPSEQALFPGVVTLALAGAGLVLRPVIYPRGVRIGLALAVVLSVVLSLGYGFPGSQFTYGLLYEYAPGWQGVRTPGRIATMTGLALSLLAAAGLQALMDRLKGTRGRSLASRPWAGPSVALLLVTAILAEGWGGPVGLTEVPVVPSAQLGANEPILHLPSDEFRDRLYMYWSTEGFPRIANGHSGFEPRLLLELRTRLGGFPDAESAAVLRSMGVRTVLLHPDLAVGSAWQNRASRGVGNLPMSRRRIGGVTVYEIRDERAR
jgi:hypothetical protein